MPANFEHIKYVELERHGEGEGEKLTAAEAVAKVGELYESKMGGIEDNQMQLAVRDFLVQAALNVSPDAGIKKKYSAEKFDLDGETGLDRYEFKNFCDLLNQGITNILKLEDFDEFVEVENDIATDINRFSPKSYLDKLTGGRSLTDTLINKYSSLSPEESEKLLQAKWGDANFGKGILFAVGREAPQMVEDVIMFLGDAAFLATAGAPSLVQYGYYRARSNFGVSEKSKHAYQMKINAMGKTHPILGLFNLLGEQGLQVMKQMGSKISNPSEWTAEGIVIAITTLIGLVAGGAGLARGGAKLGTKVARQGSRLQKVAGKAERVAGKIQKGAQKLDDLANMPVSAAGKTVTKGVKGVKKVHHAVDQARVSRNISRRAQNFSEEIASQAFQARKAELKALKKKLKAQAELIDGNAYNIKKIKDPDQRQAAAATRQETLKEIGQELKSIKKELGVMEAKEGYLKILNGETKFDGDYEGLRSMGKTLDLDMNEQAALARKVIENSGEKIEDLIDVNETIGHSSRDFDKVSTPDIINAKARSVIDQINNPIDREIIAKCWATLEEIKPGSKALSFESRIKILKSSAAYLEDARAAMKTGGLPNLKNPSDIFDLLQDNQRKLAYLDLTDGRFFTGSDHGVAHVLDGNMAMAEKLMTQLGDRLNPEQRLLIRQSIIDHDLGYTISALEKVDIAQDAGRFFGMTKDHPLYSTVWLDANREKYIHIFGEEGFDTIRQSVLDHSNAKKFNLEAEGNQLIENIVAGVDCLGVTADVKMMALFRHPEMMDKLQRIGFIWADVAAKKLPEADALFHIKKIRREMIGWVKGQKKTAGWDDAAIDGYTRAIKMNLHPEHTKFAVNRDFGSYIGGFNDIKIIDGKRLQVTFDIHGESQSLIKQLFGDKTATGSFAKAMDDYGLTLKKGKKIEVTVNGKTRQYALEDFAQEMEDLKPGQAITIETPKGTFKFRKPTQKELSKTAKQNQRLTETMSRHKVLRETLESLESPKHLDDLLGKYESLERQFGANQYVKIKGKERSVVDVLDTHTIQLERAKNLAELRKSPDFKDMINEMRQIIINSYEKPLARAA